MEEHINGAVLESFGFSKVESKSKNKIIVYTRDKVDIVLSDEGSVYYSNMGFDYILRNVSALKKLYKELRRIDLDKK